VSQIPVIPPSGGEIIGDAPGRRVEILSDRDPLHATVSRFGPGMEGADLHVHYEHSDLFFVLEGVLTVRLGVEDEQVAVGAGSLARVPPGVVHGFRNASDADMRYLNFHAPGRAFATYMRGLRDGVKVVYDQHDPPADGGRPISEVEVTSGGDVLTDVEAIRVERISGATELRLVYQLSSYFALEGDLELTAGAEEIYGPEGSWVQIPPGREHAVDGVFLRVTAPSSTA
jgi:quercetin dioxygenase-like cupin family protein